MAAHHDTMSSPSPRFHEEREAGNSRFTRWALVVGLAIIALQLFAFDRVVEQHARQAQARAADYVTVTLQRHVDDAQVHAAAPSTLLVAGN